MTCGTCKEPWDTYHLRHDAVWDAMNHLPVGMESLVKDYSERGAGPAIWIPMVRDAMKKAGWRFAGSLLAVIRCPSCDDAQPTDRAGAELRGAAAELLGDDEDALASILEDMGE